MIPWLSAGIKKEMIKTCWFLLWSKKATIKLPVLHNSVPVELGDLFINQLYSKEHSAQVLQAWVVTESKSYLIWKQVRDFCGLCYT